MIDLIVVGGGVAGMFAAITAARQGKEVVILEKNDTLGKKILITGNGRCNFTNESMNSGYYESNSLDIKDSFVSTVINKFGKDDLLRELDDLGMSYYVREGYYYPRTDEAVTFRDTLVNEIDRLPSVRVVYNYNLRSIEKTDGGYILSNKTDTYEAKNVLIATGGKSAPKTGSSGDSYYYLEKLGHNILKPYPALTNLKADYPDTLQGVNALASISLIIDGETVGTERGFIKFYKGMLSGIPIYQHSIKAVPAVETGKKVTISVDFIRDTNAKCAINRIGLSISQALSQSINPKIVDSYLNRLHISTNKTTEEFDDYTKDKILRLFSAVNYEIIGFGEFENAQSTFGGVDISEIDPETMESRKCPGLYLAGEVVDITGKCGGYNIQWATSTGVIVGRSV